MTAKLAGTLPKEWADNGLLAILDALVEQPGTVRVVVATLDVKTISVDTDSGYQRPTVRVLRIEPLRGEDGEVATRLLVRAYERRTGQTVLPLDLEDDLRGVGRDVRVDPGTGEVRG